MPRRVASQVHSTVSRLLSGSYFVSPPTWYDAVLRHPPAPLFSRDGERKPKRITYAEDSIRRQFFRDFPFEALKPRTLAEGWTARQEHGRPTGREWTELRQWGRLPSAEDTIAFTLNLHKHHDLSLANAYMLATAQFAALRAEHETASMYAALEAEAHGDVFAPTEIRRGFNVEQRYLSASQKQTAGGVDASKPRPEVPLLTEGVTMSAHAGEWTGGQGYEMRRREGVRMPEQARADPLPAVEDVLGQQAGKEAVDFMGLLDEKQPAGSRV